MTFLRFFVLAGLLGNCFTLKEEKFESETIKEDGKEIVIVRDKDNGMVITEIDIDEKQEYQLVKPEDEDVCFVLRFFTRASNGATDRPTCYKRIHAPENMLEKLQVDVSACDDREVVLLKPTGCRSTEFSDEQEFRQKRGCYEKEELVSVCVQSERGACKKKRFWGKCKEYQYVCVKTEYRVVKTKDCD